jgi:pimeloyl-ACP methyl ester carboxylesterase
VISNLFKAGLSSAAAIAAMIIAVTAFGAMSDMATTGPAAPAEVATRSSTKAQPAQERLPVVLPKMPCEELARQDFTSLPHATTRVLSAMLVPATPSTSEHCKVTGYITPQIQFELRLPTKTWIQRYLQIGCVGFCGSVDIDLKLEREGHLGGCLPQDIDEFALASGNSGHVSSGGADATWAKNAPQLKVDWGYRSEHALAAASKAIITTFYEQEPQYAYFAGCSNGGRQALMLVQRYPNDFDGVLAGALVNPVFGVVLTQAWNAKANTAADGSLVLTPDQLPLIHQAALAECNGRDGLVDGQIDDPRACQFNPIRLPCPDGQAQPDCLTLAQVETVRKIYSGPTDDQGHRLYPGGLAVGSELGWRLWLFGFSPGGPGLAELLARNYLRYLATWDEPLSYDDLHFNLSTFERLSGMSPIYAATDPDLRPFRDSGGKLILWHGWNDPSVPPLGTIAYCQAAQDAGGGLEEVQQFARLYMFPGVGHCGSEMGPSTFDLFTPLMDWAEQGVAPIRVIARQAQDGKVVRTRPVYPTRRLLDMMAQEA